MVGPLGVEPSTNGLCVLNYGFHRPFRVWSLDCLLSLRPARTVSTPSSVTFTSVNVLYEAWLGITTHIAEASPNLSGST